MLDMVRTAPVENANALASETLVLSFAEDSHFDSAKNADGERLRTIFGHADCRFIACMHAEYRGNQFVKIVIHTHTRGLHSASYECFGTTGNDRKLTHGPLLHIDEVNFAEEYVQVTFTHREH